MSLTSYSCPDEEGGSFCEPEAERRQAEARAAKLREFQGNDFDIYSTDSFSASLVIYDYLVIKCDQVSLEIFSGIAGLHRNSLRKELLMSECFVRCSVVFPDC